MTQPATRKHLKVKQPSPNQQTQVEITPVSGPRNSCPQNSPRPPPPAKQRVKASKSSLLCGNELCSLLKRPPAPTTPRTAKALSKGITYIFLSGLQTKGKKTVYACRRAWKLIQNQQEHKPVSFVCPVRGGRALALYTIGASFKMCGFTELCDGPPIAPAFRKLPQWLVF